MAIETWLAYALASALLLATPGPTVLLVVSYSLSSGWRAAMPTVAGVMLGDAIAMIVSLAGLGALLMASSDLYTVLRWAGAAYLIYLGVQLWRAPALGALSAPSPMENGAMFRNAFFVTLLNPKALVFFVAFVPQFIDPDRPFATQAAVMVVTFVGLAAVNVGLYAVAAIKARHAIRSPGVQRAVNRVSGSMLIGAGAATAAMR